MSKKLGENYPHTEHYVRTMLWEDMQFPVKQILLLILIVVVSAAVVVNILDYCLCSVLTLDW